MSTPETSTERPSRWGAFTKGAIGTVVLAIGGYLGAAMMQVISAPKDSVAYDLIQSMTGMLKPASEKPDPTPAPQAVATQQPPGASERNLPGVAPKAASAPISSTGAAPKTPEPSSSTPPPTSPAVAAAPQADAPARADVSQPAPAGTMLERVRKTAELARQAQSSTAALGESRVLSLTDRATAPICGADYKIEVSSVAAGAGEVALSRPDGAAASVTLAVGQPPRELGGGCRIVLLSTMEDLTNRRAQLREIAAK